MSRIKLRVGDQAGAMQALLRAAGLLKEAPYSVEWSTYAAAVNLHEALKADATDIGSANDAPTVSAIAGGSKVVIISAMSNGGRGTSLLVPKGSTVKTIADLRGKTVSPTTRGSVAHYLVLGLLKEAGIAPSEVKFAFLGPAEATAAFGSGSLDAWAAWSIFRARAIGLLGARVLDSGERINSGIGLLCATPATVRDPGKLAAARHYAALVARAYEWARHDREGYLNFYASFAKQDRSIVAAVYDENVAYRRVPLDDVLVERLKKTHQVWVDNGVLSASAVDFNAAVLREPKA